MWSRSRSPTRFGSTRCPSCWLNSTPPLPGESAWIQCAYHLETRAFGYVKDSKGNMFVFPSGLTASERSIRNTADGVPCVQVVGSIVTPPPPRGVCPEAS